MTTDKIQPLPDVSDASSIKDASYTQVDAATVLDVVSMTAEEIAAFEIDPEIEKQVRWQYDKVGFSRPSRYYHTNHIIAHPPSGLLHVFLLCLGKSSHLAPTFTYTHPKQDRGNLGNAKTDGFDKDIGLVKNQYNAVLTTQYVTFAFFALFGSYFVRRFGPPRVMPIFMLCWGIMAMLNAVAKNFASACVVRFILGMFEG